MFNATEEPSVEMAARSLKETKKFAKVSVTRKINEISRVMCAIQNVSEVIAMESDLDEAIEHFQCAHDEYHKKMKTLEVQDKSSCRSG